MQFFTLNIVDFDGGIVGATVEKTHWLDQQDALTHAAFIMQYSDRYKGDWRKRASLIDFKGNNITPRNLVGPVYVSPYLYGHYIMYITREILQ